MGNRNGKRWGAAYNWYVQQDRQEKYYERKKAVSRYKRLEKYEQQKSDQQEQTPAKANSKSLFERILSEGQEAIDNDYEKRLGLSFGSPSIESSDQLRSRKKKRKRKEVDTSSANPAAEAIADDVAAPHPRKKKKRSKEG